MWLVWRIYIITLQRVKLDYKLYTRLQLGDDEGEVSCCSLYNIILSFILISTSTDHKQCVPIFFKLYIYETSTLSAQWTILRFCLRPFRPVYNDWLHYLFRKNILFLISLSFAISSDGFVRSCFFRCTQLFNQNISTNFKQNYKFTSHLLNFDFNVLKEKTI